LKVIPRSPPELIGPGVRPPVGEIGCWAEMLSRRQAGRLDELQSFWILCFFMVDKLPE
jgi:hypothetical protein